MLTARALVALLVTSSLSGLVGAAPALADATGTGGTGGSGTGASDGSLTVSWLPENQPAMIVPGSTSTTKFWVTNTSRVPVTVGIAPATAIPGDRGALDISAGADSRFLSVALSPREVAIAAGVTVEVTETVTAAVDLPPGAYLLPAIVTPKDQQNGGNVQLGRSIVALTTFKEDGPVNAIVRASLDAGHAPGTLERALPWLPPVVLGDHGAFTLHVASDEPTGIYIYYEAVWAQHGPGGIGFDEHVDGAPEDTRGQPQLYFGTSRDFPLAWHAGPLAAGVDTLDATVSFNPDPQRIQTLGASATFILVSPWWLVVLLGVLAIVLLDVAMRTRRVVLAARARRNARGARARMRARAVRRPSLPGSIAATAVLATVAVALGLYATPLVLGILLVVGAGGAGVIAIVGRRRPAAVGALLLVYQGLLALVLLAAAAVVVLGLLGVLVWPSAAVAGASAASAWLVAALWLRHRVAGMPEMV